MADAWLPESASLQRKPRPIGRGSPPLPAGTLCFLFTDLEGSTRLWEAHPEAMGAVLARHDALLQEAVAAHGGVVFKTVGDGICAAFPVATDALAAALAGQRGLTAEDWGPVGPLRVRMALHAGQSQERNGDYAGQPLNRVARLLAAGHGGQILLSLAAAELVRDHLPAGAALRDLGEHRLADLHRPERIAQLLAAGLCTDFPPLRTLDTRPHNLPAQPTALVGRQRELAALAELLRGDARLVTLTGPGGVGKTRLALHTAADLLDVFPDGAWFVDLAPITDPTLVPSAIAAALKVRGDGAQSLGDVLRDFLRERRLLLVLDNVEQVVAAGAQVAELLAMCPSLKVLATSRVRLRLRGERELPVPPLPLPEPGRAIPLARLTQYEAVALFVARAGEVRPGFAVTNETAPAVAEICHRLDGLPLAIELAAARVKLLPPKALLDRLERRLGVLTGGAQDLPARQQTMRATIAWGHDLLSDEEQALFRRLAAFAGGFTLEAVEAVCDLGESLDALDGLTALADGSLVQETDGSTPKRELEPRITILETIREYALERLEASAEAGDVRTRHASYFLALAEAAEPALIGPEQGAWLSRLDADHSNLRAALGWAADGGEVETLTRLAGALWRFWDIRGHLSEGRNWLERALAASSPEPSAARAKTLNGAGNLALSQGDLARAATLLEEGLSLFRELGDMAGVATSLSHLGLLAYYRGDLARAAILHEEGLTLVRQLGDTAGIARSLNNLGMVAQEQGDLARAEVLYAECLALDRALGDPSGIASSLGNLGLVAQFQGDLDRAATLHAEGLAQFQELGDTAGIARSLNYLATVAQEQGDIFRAAALYEQSLALDRALGYPESIVCSLEGLAATAVVGQPARAARLYGAAAALREAIGLPLLPTDRDRYDRSVAKVRQQMDKAAFVAAWDAGTVLSLDQAVAMALAVTDESGE